MIAIAVAVGMVMACLILVMAGIVHLLGWDQDR